MRCQHIAKCSLSGCGHWPGTYVRSVYVLESHPPHRKHLLTDALVWTGAVLSHSRAGVELNEEAATTTQAANT